MRCPIRRARYGSDCKTRSARRPCTTFVKPSDRVGIVFSDITRATPYHLLLPAILDELAHIPDEHITLFNATGTHRPNTDAELRGMLGDAIVDRFADRAE